MIVLDNSVCMAALFDDEKEPLAISLLHAVLSGDVQAVAPPVFPYEACNAVLMAYRRKRITKRACQEYLELITTLPVQIDDAQLLRHVAPIAAKHDLTIYDAAYLELCVRQRYPLATLDRALAAAAKRVHVPLLHPAV